MIKILILLRSIDAGTGTYLKGLLRVNNIFNKGEIEIKTLVLEKPHHRKNIDFVYEFFKKDLRLDTVYVPAFSMGTDLLKEMVWFKGKVEKYNPQVVISSDPHAILISETVKLIKKYKTISLIHNNFRAVVRLRIPKILQIGFIKLFSVLARRSDTVITVSAALSRDVFRLLNLKKTPYTIPFISASDADNRKPIKEHKFRGIFVSVARFEEQKDHATLLKAFKIVSMTNPKAKLWLVGDGKLLNQSKKIAKSLNISKKVTFFGWIQDPITILDQADIFVLSSKWEGFPLSLLEAMGRGLPVIASNSDFGPGEMIVNNKYGLLSKVGDAPGLARLMVFLMNNSTKRKEYAKLAKKRFNQLLSEDTVTKFRDILILTSGADSN